MKTTTQAPLSRLLPSLSAGKDVYRHASFLAVFTYLHVAIMRLYAASIPPRDMRASYVAFAAVFALILLTDTSTKEKPSLKRTKAFTRAFLGLSLLETIFTLIAPHVFLWWAKKQKELGAADVAALYSVQDLLIPHLFVLQVQILLEMLICLSGAHPHLLFPYTLVANAYRFIPILAWVQESARLVASEEFQLVHMNWKDYTLHYVLPIMTMFLWVSSTCVFLPFVWYPLITFPDNATKHTHVN